MEEENKLSNYISYDSASKMKENYVSQNDAIFNKQISFKTEQNYNSSDGHLKSNYNPLVANPNQNVAGINQTNPVDEINFNSNKVEETQTSHQQVDVSIINQNKDEIKLLCISIFNNFSKFSKEDLQFMLSYQNIIKILRLLNIVGNKEDQQIKNNEIDALLKKANHGNKKFNLKQFTNFLVFLSQRLEPAAFATDAKLCLAKTVKQYFEPLNDYIQDQITSGNAGDYFQHTIVLKYLSNVVIDSPTIFIANSVYAGLKNLYSAYFNFEIQHMNEKDKVLKSSLNGLIEFCKEFEILNFIVSLDKLAAYFYFLVDFSVDKILNNNEISEIFNKERELGKLFTLSKFVVFLIHIAFFSFEKNSKYLESLVKRRKTLSDMGIDFDNMGTAEKLILLLDKLDSGEGIKKWEKKITKGYNAKISLMPSVETVAHINPLIQKTLQENFAKPTTIKSNQNFQNLYSTNYKSNYLTNQKSLSSLYNSNNSLKNKHVSTGEIIDIKLIFPYLNDSNYESLYEKLSAGMDDLKHLFEAYSTIGFKTDIYNMSLSGFIKFGAEADVILKKEFTIRDSGLNISKCTGVGINKIDYASHFQTNKLKLNEVNEDKISVDYNTINYENENNNDNDKNKFIESLRDSERKNSGKTSNRKRTASFDSEAVNEKQAITSNDNSIIKADMINNTNININGINTKENKIFKSDFNMIYFYLCGLQNFDASKKIRNQFDKNAGYNPNFENSLKGPSLDNKNLMKADKDLKPLKMNFTLFVKSFELIATKVYKEIDEAQALEMFFDQNLSQLLKKKKIEGNSSKQNYLAVLNDLRRDDIFEIIRIIIPLIYPHYLNYCDKFELIDFELFNQFFRDFDIFPSVINLMQIKSIFFSLQESIVNQLNISKDNSLDSNYKNEIINNLKINFDFFMDGILLSSFHLKEIEELSEIEKIIQIVERMSISPGIAKSQLRSGLTFSSQKEFKKSIKDIKAKLGILNPNEQKNVLKADDCFEEIFN